MLAARPQATRMQAARPQATRMQAARPQATSRQMPRKQMPRKKMPSLLKKHLHKQKKQQTHQRRSPGPQQLGVIARKGVAQVCKAESCFAAHFGPEKRQTQASAMSKISPKSLRSAVAKKCHAKKW